MVSFDYYGEQDRDPDDVYSEGIVILSDFDTHENISGCRVIVFNDSDEGDESLNEFKKTDDIDVAFQAARDGHAEEISIERLVKFYLANS